MYLNCRSNPVQFLMQSHPKRFGPIITIKLHFADKLELGRKSMKL